MEIPIYQVDAFADEVFIGNPAAICPLDEWLPEATMQAIAAENNLSETAFCVANGDGYHIRWFTPEIEVALCGHATLASAYVIFHELGFSGDQIRFSSLSGELLVSRNGELLQLDFPGQPPESCDVPDGLLEALGGRAEEIYYSAEDYIVVYARQADIEALTPDFHTLRQIPCRGVVVTAKGNEVDFVSRFFAPAVGVDEDPVTGSAHCKLTPYWAERLGKTRLQARQLSCRGGALECELSGDRVLISGLAVKYLQGLIYI